MLFSVTKAITVINPTTPRITNKKIKNAFNAPDIIYHHQREEYIKLYPMHDSIKGSVVISRKYYTFIDSTVSINGGFMTSIGYVRISNEKKQDPTSQIKLMLDQGIEMKNIFVDMGTGASIPSTRESYIKMTERLKAGDVTELVFSEYSRIGRDVIESLGAVLDIMRSFKDTKLRSLASSEKDINDYPIEMQFILIMFGMGAAKRERDHIKERTQWGMDNAKAKGTRSGKAIGRPTVSFDYAAVDLLVKEKNLKEAQAIRVLGYKPSTYYKAKKTMDGV